MKSFVCEMCGGNDIEKADGMYVCKSCGTKFTPEEAKKLLVEVTVKQDNSGKIETLLSAAQKARESQNWKSAEVYYQDLFAEDPDNWEAAYFSVYAVSMQCKIANIASACANLTNVLLTTFKLIAENVPDDQKAEAVSTVAAYTSSISDVMFESALSHHMEIDASIKSKYNGELKSRLDNAMILALTCGEAIDAVFGDTEIGKYAVKPILKGLGFNGRQSFVVCCPTHDYEEKMISIVEKFDSSSAEQLKAKKASREMFVLKSGIVLAIIGAICIFCGFMVAKGGFWTFFLRWMGYFLAAWGAIKVILYVVTMAGRKNNS
ncbi:MAG: TFIIB-type zinc finger domain-containing protein [Clostridia bacterium]|nr:TFIIB-type zinc finger domain-containing protein [Clostridia bacterium]